MKYPEVESLLLFAGVVNALRETSKNKKKQQILEDALKDPKLSGPCEHYLRIVNDPFRKHYLTSDKLGNADGSGLHTGVQLTHALELFACRKITGNEQRAMWNAVLLALPTGLIKIANGILDKDLGIRMGLKETNKAFKSAGLRPIAAFSVALGEAFADKSGKERVPDLFGGGKKWVWSRKYDGLRNVMEIGAGRDVTCRTRKGHEFKTLDKLVIRGRLWKGAPCVLDGEVALWTPDGSDDFKGILKEWGRKNHTIARPRMHVFDCIPLDEFISGKGVTPFSERQRMIDEVLAVIDPDGERFVRVKQHRVRTRAEIENYRQRAVLLGQEGGILRRVRPYCGKRSDDILKVKTFFTEEFRVVSTEVGSIHEVINGREMKIRAMTSVKIKYKGNLVGVGSGFTMPERKEYRDDEDAIVGKIISVRHFGETTDEKTGLPSLRFPTFQGIYGKKRNV